MSKFSSWDWAAFFLVALGGINWGLLAINQSWNLAELIFGGYNVFTRVVYLLIAVAAIYLVVKTKQTKEQTQNSNPPAGRADIEIRNKF